MKDPKILLSRIWVIFDVICFLLALFMTLKNIARFLDDANATTITYKKFGHTVDDKYPALSACFEGEGIYRFNESAIFTAYNIHLIDYEQMVRGGIASQYKYNHSSRRYSKNSLRLNFEPNFDFKVQDLFRIPDIVKTTGFVDEDETPSSSFEKKLGISAIQDTEEPSFNTTYQSSNMFCLIDPII